MRSLWRESEARRWARATADPAVGLRIYSARLLGEEPDLVLAAGGSTSVKSLARNLLGEPEDVIYVQAGEVELATVDADGFAPVALAPARRLLDLESVDDATLRREMRRLRLDPEAPSPSPEALLHAFLPHRYVDHTHADAILCLTETKRGLKLAEGLFGDEMVFVPYHRAGFELARRAARAWADAIAAGRLPVGMILLGHGILTVGDEARVSYERMINAVDRAERLLREQKKPNGTVERTSPPRWTAPEIAALRRELSQLAGRPLVVRLDDSPRARSFADRADVAGLVRRGPVQPEHVVHTRGNALVLRAPAEIARGLARWAADYRREFARLREGRELRMNDPAPRVVVVPGTGILAAGDTAAAAQTASDIYRHTIDVLCAAESLGGFRPLGEREIFEVEYAPREHAPAPARQPLAGRVAVVTGAASGIGKACVAALRAQGAAVVALDLVQVAGGPDLFGIVCDATDRGQLRAAMRTAVDRFGGVDVLVSNLGVFAGGQPIASLDERVWRRTFDLNLDSHFALLQEAAPLLSLAVDGGSVVVIGSDKVPAPGPGAAAFSASKAALTQLARVAALELAPQGIRVNVLHPDSVFDTSVWTPERLAEKAQASGVPVDELGRHNLLRIEVHAADVGALAAALCTPLFAKTTGAQIPIDGGNERVI